MNYHTIDNMYRILKSNSDIEEWYFRDECNLRGFAVFLYSILEITADKLHGSDELESLTKVPRKDYNLTDYPDEKYYKVEPTDFKYDDIPEQDYILLYHLNY